MNSRERILATLNHEEPDRVATFIWINEDARDALMSHIGVDAPENLEEALGIDRWRDVWVGSDSPVDYEARVARFVPDEFRDRKDLEIGANGTVRKPHREISYLDDVVHYPLQDVSTPSELDAYPFNLPDQVHEVSDDLRKRVEELKQGHAVVQGGVEQPYKTGARLRGMENFLCDFLIRPELAGHLYDLSYDFNTAMAVRLAEAGVDVITIVGDIAMQDRLMMSPEVWREFDKPRLTRMIAAAKSVNPDVKIYMHSDGDMKAIVGDLIEAGLDILNPIQPECMDPFEMKKQWGDKLVLHGGVSMQRTLPFGTVEDVAAEVRRLCDVCGKGGGYVLGPANVIIKEFPVENVAAMYRAV